MNLSHREWQFVGICVGLLIVVIACVGKILDQGDRITQLTQERNELITTRDYLNRMIARGSPMDTIHHGSGEWTSDSNQIYPDSILNQEAGE